MNMISLRKPRKKDNNANDQSLVKAILFGLVFLFSIVCALSILSAYSQVDVRTFEYKAKAIFDFSLTVTLSLISIKKVFAYLKSKK